MLTYSSRVKLCRTTLTGSERFAWQKGCTLNRWRALEKRCRLRSAVVDRSIPQIAVCTRYYRRVFVVWTRRLSDIAHTFLGQGAVLDIVNFHHWSTLIGLQGCYGLFDWLKLTPLQNFTIWWNSTVSRIAPQLWITFCSIRSALLYTKQKAADVHVDEPLYSYNGDAYWKKKKRLVSGNWLHRKSWSAHIKWKKEKEKKARTGSGVRAEQISVEPQNFFFRQACIFLYAV